MVQEGSINVYKHLGERIMNTQADLSHWAPACMVRSNKNNPKSRKFHCNSPKFPIFTVREVRQSRLPRGAVSSASLENSEPQWAGPREQWGLDQGMSKGPFHPLILELFTHGKQRQRH